MSVRRSRLRPLPVMALVALLWATALLVVWPSASQAGPVKGSLAVISVADQSTGFVGAVAGRPFSVVVEARDPLGVPLVLTQDTKVRLSLVSGSGSLGGVLEGTIPKRTSRGTLSGATYAPFANGITLGLATVSGTALGRHDDDDQRGGHGREGAGHPAQQPDGHRPRVPGSHAHVAGLRLPAPAQRWQRRRADVRRLL